MKKVILILILFCINNSANAYTFDQYSGQVSQESPAPNNQQYVTKIYDNKGRYQGRFEKTNTTTKVYDSKGFYQYSFVQPVSR